MTRTHDYGRSTAYAKEVSFLATLSKLDSLDIIILLYYLLLIGTMN